MEITEKEIAKQLAELINKNVNKLNNDDQKYKNHYESVMEELEYEIKQAELVIEDYTDAKLTFNKIEQEGYLRCLKTIVNKFRDIENYI